MSLDNSTISQFLTFIQGEDTFAINIHSIKEVLDIRKLTTIPCSLPFMRGVMNLRGQVVPVIDLKLKFGLAQTAFSVDTCIIILQLNIDNTSCLFGVLVDSVSEVIDLADRNISPPLKWAVMSIPPLFTELVNLTTNLLLF